MPGPGTLRRPPARTWYRNARQESSPRSAGIIIPPPAGAESASPPPGRAGEEQGRARGSAVHLLTPGAAPADSHPPRRERGPSPRPRGCAPVPGADPEASTSWTRPGGRPAARPPPRSDGRGPRRWPDGRHVRCRDFRRAHLSQAFPGRAVPRTAPGDGSAKALRGGGGKAVPNRADTVGRFRPRGTMNVSTPVLLLYARLSPLHVNVLRTAHGGPARGRPAPRVSGIIHRGPLNPGKHASSGTRANRSVVGAPWRAAGSVAVRRRSLFLPSSWAHSSAGAG